MAIDQTVSCFRAAGPTGVGLLLLAVWALLLARPAPDWTFAWFAVEMVLGLLFVSAWYMIQRVVISRSQHALWRGVLLGVAVLTAGSWAMWHAHAAMDLGAPQAMWQILVAVTGLALVSALVVAWLPGMLAVVPSYFVAGALYIVLLDGPAEAYVILAAGAVPLLVFGVLISRFVRAYIRARAQSNVTRAELARVQSAQSDAEARNLYEQQQRADVEQELLQVRELADSANRAKTEFLATMSHEIRTPLNGILPILEMLRDTGLNQEQGQLVNTAFNSSRHLLRIINDILDFAKAESGKLQLENIEIDLRELVGSVADLMARSAEKRQLKLHVNVDDSVPGTVRGDPIRLRQILTNLVSNAIKFTDEGGIKIEVNRLRVSRKEVELLFSVSDTGMGMSRETARQLFQSFTQADASTTRKHGGTGLGLVICRRLVELMGGKIGVRARLGEGSTFWFVLPMRKSVVEVPSARKNLNGVRVLTLIHDGELAERVSMHVSGWGMLEERAKSEADAVSKLHSSAMLGQSWAYEVFLVNIPVPESRLRRMLQELVSLPALQGLRILVGGRGERASEALVDEFGVYILNEMHRPEPLRRLLHRLLDVEGNADSAFDDDTIMERYRDLNVELLDEMDGDLPELTVKAAAPTTSYRGRVLLVEDNPVNLSVVRKVLSRLGVECVTAHNGQEALDKVAADTFDLVYMDCQMPVMDGYEATRRLRDREQEQGLSRMPIVAMTANAMAGDREKCIEAGMDDYLAKPVSMAQLSDNLGNWLEKRGDSVWTDSHPAPVAAAPAAVSEHLTSPGMANTLVSDEIIDTDTLNELREVMEDEFIKLIRTYLENAPGLVGELEQALTAGDIDAAVIPAHSLKSSSANVGALSLSGVAKEIEFAARGEQLDGAREAMDRFRPLFAATVRALRAYL